MKRAIGITFGAIVVFAIFLYFRLGMNRPVALSQVTSGPFNMVYRTHVGPYYKIVSTIEFVEAWTKKNNIDCKVSYGEYIDDPETVSEDRLQSHGGCVVAELPPASLLEEGMKAEVKPLQLYLKGEFEGAPSVGPYTVYPKAFEWISKNGYQIAGPVIEMYTVLDAKSVRTEYLFPIKKTAQN